MKARAVAKAVRATTRAAVMVVEKEMVEKVVKERMVIMEGKTKEKGGGSEGKHIKWR